MQGRVRAIANFFADLVVGDGTNAGKRVTAYSGASLRARNPSTLYEINGSEDSNGVFVG